MKKKKVMIKGKAYWGIIWNLSSTRKMPGAASCGAVSARRGLPAGHAACAVAHTLHLKRSCALLNALLLLS